MNPKQMKKMMRQMGIQQVDLDAEVVVITLADKEIVIHQPNVAKVTMMGQETYQITGTIEERARESEDPEIVFEDVETVMDKTNVGEDEARQALLEAKGDLADAILSLSED